MERQNVESSLAASVGYDPTTSTLEIEFKTTGAVWQYYDVPENVFNEMMNGSIGKYFHANIKGQYSESQVG
ncbi:MAG: KTSC domain-containing protein [Bacteroidetes bacterium]|nr:KTSC domain-containing protein [Bacteroidota bacterium]